ncbi:hypothetical protein Thexy_1010 [Thermoanaerobacterium xylanolyticum LX-11]|uniref:Uncharacterized protein n=1 Tax=Thermoanaerobacterium xylanolyticum (strain ATCC 49914 / DSM 7097 / LX-11) TaxID=858215 RepID=F6BK48_THEXL|nr:hypothetical protein [Thermoanaerobacterium xylanolyticum]AEF17043.1 hypothetical protein Thexy_1010 [Thermoanaerobacterium xylanolyticum LX-11]
MKKIPIITLYTINTIIFILALTFILYSISMHNTIIIFSNSVPAFIMALPIVYLVIIYFVRIYNLSKNIKDKKFSIRNFKRI